MSDKMQAFLRFLEESELIDNEGYNSLFTVNKIEMFVFDEDEVSIIEVDKRKYYIVSTE